MKPIKVKVTEKAMKSSLARIKLIKDIPHTFMKNRKLNGLISEEMFKELYPHASRSKGENVYDFDFYLEGQRIEIKTKTWPNPTEKHEFSLNMYSKAQKCDYYVFFCIDHDLEYVWLCGWITPKNYAKKAFWVKKGSKLANGKPARVDTLNIKISELNQNFPSITLPLQKDEIHPKMV